MCPRCSNPGRGVGRRLKLTSRLVLEHCLEGIRRFGLVIREEAPSDGCDRGRALRSSAHAVTSKMCAQKSMNVPRIVPPAAERSVRSRG